MARPVKRNRAPINELDYAALPGGIYLDEVQFGMIHKMELHKQPKTNVDEFVFKGKLHRGEVRFITGDKLTFSLPVLDGYNHGFTLEGKAKDLFQVKDALDVFSENENRTFNYTKASSKLFYIGNMKEEITLYVTFYENCYGDNTNRWAVLYAE